MSSPDKRPYVARRCISLSEQEDQRLRKRAESAGMTVTAFIKRAALSNTIKILDMPIISQHVIAIGTIANDIHAATSFPHPDRWLYQADLERIEDTLDQLIAIESDIQESIRRKMK